MSVHVAFWIGLFIVGLTVAFTVYRIALRIQLMALVDTLWTGGLGIAALLYFWIVAPDTIRANTVLLLVLVWSFRLTYHIFSDRVLPGKEDPRYKRLADYWGENASRKFLFVFLGQVPLIAIFLLPVSTAMKFPVSGFRLLDIIAVLIAVFAMFGEAVADRQLAKFRADSSNEGGVCKNGLWRYSRHPNYFFEWLHWWAYVCFAWGSDNWWISLLGPVAMFVFLRYITGVPPAEKSSLQSRGEAYQKYQKTTNAFFPWIPHEPRS